jgi:hypothetical protein
LFCRYEPYQGSTGGCYALNSQHDTQGRGCPTLISACEKDGKLFYGVDPSALTSANGYGEGVSCSANGGTAVGGSTNPPGTTDPPGTGTATHCRWDNDPDNCWPFSTTGTDPTPNAASCISKSGEPVSDCNAESSGVWCDWGASGGCYFITNGIDDDTGEDYGSPSAKCTATTGTIASQGSPARCSK